MDRVFSDIGILKMKLIFWLKANIPIFYEKLFTSVRTVSGLDAFY